MAANALLFPSSVSAAPIGRPAVPLCTDIDLANCYTGLVTSGAQILFVANAFTVAMWSRPSTTDSWVLSAAGEFGVECISIVSSSIGKKRTYWLATVQPSPQDQDVTSENGALVKVGLTRSWLRKSDEVTGRFGNASADVKNEVAYLAAHRCQFSGAAKTWDGMPRRDKQGTPVTLLTLSQRQRKAPVAMQYSRRFSPTKSQISYCSAMSATV